jgi:para-aminobenzoate synthetase/4-amino-4-deoxychorismate lyase
MSQAPASQHIPPTAVARRPDSSLGVFETLLVRDGRAIEPSAHMERLARSLRALYGLDPPTEAQPLLAAAAAPLRLGRVRLAVVPRRGGERCEVSAAEVEPALHFPPPERAAALRTWVLRGGLGAHKWVDRGVLPELGGGEAALLAEPGGELLEAATANLFSVAGGRLVTPPTDGRILPGVTRGAVLELAAGLGVGVEERPLRAEELYAAEEVFLTSSVRGVEAAGSLDGEPLGGARRLSRLLADALRRRWEGPN